MNYVIQGQTLTGIADAIRAQLGTQEQYTPESMAAAIQSISGSTNNWTDVISGNTTAFFDKSALTITNYAFQSNNVITSAAILNAKNGGASCFQGLQKLECLYLPSLKTAGNLFAYQSKKLKWAYMGQIENLPQYIFNGDTALSALILGTSEVASLTDSSCLASSGISSGTGYIYVLDELVTQYQVATNWATYAAQIKGLSEIPADVQEWLDQMEAA